MHGHFLSKIIDKIWVSNRKMVCFIWFTFKIHQFVLFIAILFTSFRTTVIYVIFFFIQHLVGYTSACHIAFDQCTLIAFYSFNLILFVFFFHFNCNSKTRYLLKHVVFFHFSMRQCDWNYTKAFFFCGLNWFVMWILVNVHSAE